MVIDHGTVRKKSPNEQIQGFFRQGKIEQKVHLIEGKTHDLCG